MAMTAPASYFREIGIKGGLATAKRGPEYYRKISGLRKTIAGGRPPKKKAEAVK